ncbi:dihydrodipicolinate synthase family protein [Amycolatopsis jejuensis]|uniref:dihydrodipicolinate synthase family protein n=1 Tax=Amycolatopsis jejuensis TaxID=330084 RepID=UPI00052667EA|nr:dihydrodipicolinate synthase family protein [Amycolatopsis jejuensis]
MSVSIRVMMVTPFGPEGTLDVEALRQHVDAIAAAGLDVFIGGSSPGQGYTLSAAETVRLYEVSREAAAGRIRVYASGFEPRQAGELIELAKVVADSGLDGMQVYSLDLGHGGRPGPREIERYFRTVLDGVSLPVVLSTHENMGYLVPPEVLSRLLADYPQVQGLHVNTGQMSYVLDAVRVAAAAPHPVTVHSGSVGYGFSAVALGADGFLSAEANLAPELAAGVAEEWARGEFDSYRRLCSLSPVLEFGSATRGIKAAMRLLGRAGSELREPLLALAEPEDRIVADALVRAGLMAGEGEGHVDDRY